MRTWEIKAAIDTAAAATVRIIFIISIRAHYYSDHLSKADAPPPQGGEDLRLLAPHLHRLGIPSLFPFFPKCRWPGSYFVELVRSEGPRSAKAG